MEVKDIIKEGRPAEFKFEGKYTFTEIVSLATDNCYKTGVHDGYEYALEEFENNRIKACDNQTPEEAERESAFVVPFVKEHHRQPTFSDAIEGTRKQMIDKACKWLEQNVDKYLYNTGGYEEYIPKCGDKLFYDFKKAMEE
jgi:hypothetical protein